MGKRNKTKKEVAQNVQPAKTNTKPQPKPQQAKQQEPPKDEPKPQQPPQPGSYNTRVCVPAPMPIMCPHCGSTKTTAANGVHYNLHYGTRYEHRACSACGFTFTAARRMTRGELAAKCGK